MPTQSVEEWRTAQTAQHLSNRTIADRTSTVRRLAQHLDRDPATATSVEVSGFLASLEVGRWSGCTYHSHLKAWFRWLVFTEQRPDDPMGKVPAPRRPRLTPNPVSDRELHAILACRMHYTTRTKILLAAYQGLRVHEIAKVRGEDVNVHDRLLRVEGKGGVVAWLPLHPVIAEQAKRYPVKGWWFPSHTMPGRHVRGQSVTQMIGKVFRRAHVAPGAHRLRHWYGTKLLDATGDLRLVQELMRHASVSSTQIYTLVSNERHRTAIDGLRLTDLQVAA